MKSRRYGKFIRNALPNPSEYYSQQGLKLKGRGEWRTAKCPFHEDHNPSLKIRIENGAFRCMSCWTKGGDVLAFHMKLYKLRFIEASKALGAWEYDA
jgi:DNA primase